MLITLVPRLKVAISFGYPQYVTAIYYRQSPGLVNDQIEWPCDLTEVFYFIKESLCDTLGDPELRSPRHWWINLEPFVAVITDEQKLALAINLQLKGMTLQTG